MKKHVLFLMIAVPMLFASCSSSKFFSQKASDIRPIALVESYSYITDAVADFSTDYLPDASRFNQLLITDVVNSIGLPSTRLLLLILTLPIPIRNSRIG